MTIACHAPFDWWRFLMCHYPRRMKLRSGIVLATLALVPLAACSSGTAATTSAPAPATSSAATSARPSASASAPASASNATYTMAQVATHNSQQDCWAVIDKNVYNLTQWINRHPGGPDKIIPLCGTDATSNFHGQHDDQSRPNEQLATFKVGTVKS